MRLIQVGDIVSGTMVEVLRSKSVLVELDGDVAAVAATGPLELSWRRRVEDVVQIGRRVRAGVTEVAPDGSQILLSLAATENPAVSVGQRVTGAVPLRHLERRSQTLPPRTDARDLDRRRVSPSRRRVRPRAEDPRAQ